MAYNVLIVDDSPTVRAVIAKTLQLAGVETAEIHHAANGREGLSALEENWIDFVFADINMPVMNGLEMVEEMARRDLMASVPVIVVSTEGSQTRIEKLKSKGISAYIRKPFTPEILRNVVEDVLGVIHEE
jgi:two-component system chemotaxis response regulator CheY